MAIIYSGDEECSDEITSGCDKPDYDVWEENEVAADHEERDNEPDGA